MSDRPEPPEEEEMLAPLWVVTYGDLISLLVTFFVLIFTFSAMDVDNFRRVQGALTGGVGVMTDGAKSKAASRQPIVPATAQTDLRGVEELPERSELAPLNEAMSRLVQDDRFDTAVSLRENPDGLSISMPSDALFDLGTTRLTGKGVQLIKEVARFFREESVRMVIEAHTDDRTPSWMPGETAESLTVQWARAAATVMVAETRWSPARVGVSPQGALRPVASNASVDGRRTNRRLEIRVMPNGVGQR